MSQHINGSLALFQNDIADKRLVLTFVRLHIKKPHF